jgi:hypothetical protein
VAAAAVAAAAVTAAAASKNCRSWAQKNLYDVVQIRTFF